MATEGKTYKIILACSAGMSTSILVEAMKTYAKKQGISVEINAMPTSEARNLWQSAEVLLLGPQVRYEMSSFKKTINGQIPVDSIAPQDYGLANGEAVLKLAIKLIDGAKK